MGKFPWGWLALIQKVRKHGQSPVHSVSEGPGDVHSADAKPLYRGPSYINGKLIISLDYSGKTYFNRVYSNSGKGFKILHWGPQDFAWLNLPFREMKI